MRFKTGLFVVLALAAAIPAGCRTSTRSNLPDHIASVEVEVFRNNTMYKNLEGRLTRAVIDGINRDARIRAVSGGGDAVITGEIIEVIRMPVRQTITDRAATSQLVVRATFSFYDVAERKYLIRDAPIASNEMSVASGLYEASMGELAATAETSALELLGAEIVRRTLGMW